MARICELVDLPEHVRKGDFVVVLNEGIAQAEKTVGQYALTHGLIQAFGRSLSLIRSGLMDGRSQAAYLHGSFGSGKSHFMAVLDLMLEGHPAPWERAELHPLRKEHSWLGERRLLRLPMHMIGADSIEQQVFQTYIEFVAEHHADAPMPALFGDVALFKDANALRDRLGDEAFFASLGDDAVGVDDGWGALGSNRWDAERFDAACASAVMEEREALFSALTKTHFRAYTGQRQNYLDLDRGLEVLTRHAQGLGYDAVVLFLDELILWLAGRMSDRAFVQEEAQKLAKLKEAQHAERKVPLISFIARQRDLAELVGKDAAGVEMASLRDSLDWSSGRFETIVLEDRNLPAVVERRVLRPTGDDEAQLLRDGFVGMRRRVGRSWETLLGSFADEEDFRRVYPFSPALLETLVALSNCLQRERTAIRILVELLVEHLPELETGDVVPLGDVFDVIAGGEDAFDHIMRDRFDNARHIYAHQLLPMIQAEHGTGSRARCQRLRDEHPTRLGCSGCSEAMCRNDNRLAKTLLLAALVPEAAPFKDLTVRRLVDLNHGIVRAPIPGTEVGLVAGRLRNWATQVGQLRIGDQSDPEVFLRLEGVPLKPILQSAQSVDTPGARKNLLKQLLFEGLGLPVDGSAVVERKVSWRGTRRTGVVRFGNVRELSDDALQCPGVADWYLVIDYPFDDAGHTPEDDAIRVSRFVDDRPAAGNPGFVWLPSFFSDGLQRELGELAALEEILTGDNPRRYLQHLRTEDQARARLDLDSMRNQKRARVKRALGQAYGIHQVTDEGILDPSRTAADHWLSLQPGLTPRPLLASDLGDALGQLAIRLLEHRFPHHPRFGVQLTRGRLEKVWSFFEGLVDAPDQRAPVPSAEIADLKDIAEPLGIVRITESSVLLEAAPLREMEQHRERLSIRTPTVEQTRGLADPQGTLGLPDPAGNLMVLAYALWSGRSLRRGGQLVATPRLGKLADDIELVLAQLPDETAWAAAIDQAGALLGVAIPGRARTARNLERLSTETQARIADLSQASDLPAALERRLRDWGQVSPPPPRLRSAISGKDLLANLSTDDAGNQVRVLAEFEPETSATALGKSLSAAASVVRRLNDEGTWNSMLSVQALRGDGRFRERAADLLDRLREALEADELNQALDASLRTLTTEAGALIREASPPVELRDPGESPFDDPGHGNPRWRRRWDRRVELPEATRRVEAVSELLDEIRAEVNKRSAATELKLIVELHVRERDE